MVKGIFTGDFHYGRMVEDLDRTPDIHKAANFMVDQAIEQKCDFVSIGGDLTDNNTPHPDLITKLISILNRLEDAEIVTFVVRGNHCSIAATGRVWALTPLEEIGYNNIHFITTPKLINFDGLELLFLPHVTKSDALEAGFNTAQEFLDAEAEKLLEQVENRATVISHYNINGAKAGTEALMLRQSDLQLPSICIRSPKVAKIINSHIHTAQENGKIIMPGSLICTDFGDLQSVKGFLVGNYNISKPEWKFSRVPTPASPMEEFEINLLGLNQEQIGKELESSSKLVTQDAIVKIRILVEEENLPMINFEEVKEKFSQKARFIKQIDKIITRKKQVRDTEQKTCLSPKDAVNRYLDKRNPEGKDRKLAIALKIITGEKLEIQESEAPFLNATAAKDSLDINLDALDLDISIPDEYRIN